MTSTRLVVTCISCFKGEGGGENGLFLMLLFVFVLSIVFNIFDLLIRLEGLLPAVKKRWHVPGCLLMGEHYGFGNAAGHLMRVFNTF